MTKEQFESLTPFDRGYMVYMCGERDDEPNVPNEKNPYPAGSDSWVEWIDGQFQAMISVQEMEE